MKTITPSQEAKPSDRSKYVSTTIHTFRTGGVAVEDHERRSLALAVSSHHSEVLAWTDDEYDNPFIDDEDLDQLAEIYDEAYALRMVRKDEAAAVAQMKEELRTSRLSMRP
ncbi:hypothetical protein [Xanthomonas arboricola]|uniref:Uncharacterized protein n=1 Tax=Xanthomonas arboricola TaxID=56448 RepID=A0AB73H3T1_9XANT|nr:hypothetical protein [Xanthomonas arboricola]MBB5672333.1 hypothetical protein [Xanthomonas arboricola]